MSIVYFGQFSSYLVTDKHTKYGTCQMKAQILKKYIIVYQSSMSNQLHFLS